MAVPQATTIDRWGTKRKIEKIEGNLTIYCSIVLQSIHITFIVLLWRSRCWKSSHPLHTYIWLWSNWVCNPKFTKKKEEHCMCIYLDHHTVFHSMHKNTKKKGKISNPTMELATFSLRAPLSMHFTKILFWRASDYIILMILPWSEVVLHHNKHFYVTVCFDYYSYATNFITITHWYWNNWTFVPIINSYVRLWTLPGTCTQQLSIACQQQKGAGPTMQEQPCKNNKWHAYLSLTCKTLKLR